MCFSDINLYILIIITALVFFALFGDWSLIAGLMAGVVMCPLMLQAMRDDEGFEGREIRLDDQCVVKDPSAPRCPDMPYWRWVSRAYDKCDEPAAVEFNCDSTRRLSGDEKNMYYGQLRGKRDRRMWDGIASRNQYTYMKNFGDELSKSEAKNWAGQYEY